AFDLGYERSMRLIDRLSDVVIVNSQAVRADMGRWVDAEKLRLLYYAVEVAREVAPLSPSSRDVSGSPLIEITRASRSSAGEIRSPEANAISSSLAETGQRL
ncbi:MAG: hypothetical protein KY432_08120, partial [Acidobacteria bacterium]|nr:hypothetical protein [Acidobacteriota bacterium]